jgi:hypothetical protein
VFFVPARPEALAEEGPWLHHFAFSQEDVKELRNELWNTHPSVVTVVLRRVLCELAFSNHLSNAFTCLK